MGRRQRRDLGGARSSGCATRSTAHLGEGDVYVVDAFAGADPAHRIAVRVDHARARGTRSSRRRSSSIRPRRSSSEMEIDALVLHAPSVVGRPGGGRDPERHLRRASTRRASEVLIGGTYYAGEIKKSIFTLHERPAPARRRLPDALLGERRRRRLGRGVLRALGHGQDDALGRSRAAPDRRRRARLVGRRRLQLRGRLLREGDPALARRPSRRSTGRRAAFGTVLENVVVDERGSPRPRRRLEDREHARGVQARADRERPAGRSARAIRARSCSSPRTRSGSCRRSRG